MKKIKSSDLKLKLSVVTDLTGGGAQTQVRADDESGVDACETFVGDCAQTQNDECDESDKCWTNTCPGTEVNTCDCSDECNVTISHNVQCCELTMEVNCGNTGLCQETDTTCSVEVACIQTRDYCIESDTCPASKACTPVNP